MPSSPRVVIIDQDPDARFRIQQLVTSLGFSVVAQTGIGTEAVSTVSEANPDIVLCGFAEPVTRVGQTIEAITHATKDVPVLAYAPNRSWELVRQAMLAGARDFLPSPLEPEELKRSLTAALEAGERRRMRDAPGGNLLGPEGAIITVFGAKGGVGKTTVAVNLAIGLVQEAGQKVLLVDADDSFGDSAASLALQAEYSVTDLLRDGESPESLEKQLTHHKSGLAVAAGPSSPLEWRSATPERLVQLLRRAARLFDVVVVDTGGSFSEIGQAALETASLILWVTSPEYNSVRDSVQALHALRAVRIPEDRIRFVLNLTSWETEATPASVADALGHQLVWIVPHDAQARRAAQLGHPLIEEHPNSPAGLTFANMARALSGLPPRTKDTKRQRRWLRPPRLPGFRRRQATAEQEARA
jgi:pilus assembly protein CpaE